MDADANKKDQSPVEAMQELMEEIDKQRSTTGGIMLDGHQTDHLLSLLKSMLLVLQQQQTVIEKVSQIIRD